MQKCKGRNVAKSPADRSSKGEGVRQRKQRETRQRIAATGLRLFLTDGYETTTLDAIAKAAGISRRTFFSYFTSKDDILLQWQSGAWDAICEEVAEVSATQAPIDAVISVFLRYAERHQSDEMLRIDRLLRSSDSLRSRKQAYYATQERALFDSLCQVWPLPERRDALRMVAMASIGAMRLAIEAWSLEDGKHPVRTYVVRAFAHLKAEI